MLKQHVNMHKFGYFGSLLRSFMFIFFTNSRLQKDYLSVKLNLDNNKNFLIKFAFVLAITFKYLTDLKYYEVNPNVHNDEPMFFD